MNTIQEKWENYQHEVLLDTPIQIEIETLEMAFYAGAFSMLNLLSKVSHDASLSNDAVNAILQGWKNEIESFFIAIDDV